MWPFEPGEVNLFPESAAIVIDGSENTKPLIKTYQKLRVYSIVFAAFSLSTLKRLNPAFSTHKLPRALLFCAWLTAPCVVKKAKVWGRECDRIRSAKTLQPDACDVNYVSVFGSLRFRYPHCHPHYYYPFSNVSTLDSIRFSNACIFNENDQRFWSL